MQVTVTMTGGILGVHEQLGPVDTAKAPNGSAIEEKIDGMYFYDALVYEIEVADGGRRHSVSFVASSDPTLDDLQQLMALVAEGAGRSPDTPFSDASPARCDNWWAGYVDMPPNPDPVLRVVGRCSVPPGKHLVLAVGNIGTAPEPGMIALQATLEDGDGGEGVGWSGDVGSDVKLVAIEGAVSALIDVRR